MIFVLLIAAVFTFLPVSSARADSSTILGRVENVVVEDIGMKMKARIDTGAGVTSLHAGIVEIKDTPAGQRVIFTVKDASKKQRTLEREVVDWLNIKGKGTKREIKRPVVRLRICLAGKRIEGRVNLADRSNFLYPLLIGRNILKAGEFLVDPRQKFTERPGCEEAKGVDAIE